MDSSSSTRSAAFYILPLILLGFLAFSKVRYDRDLTAAEALLDSTRSSISRSAGQLDSALAAGDSLPPQLLLDSKGAGITLADLPRLGYAYIYLYREDCPACSLIKPFVDSIRSEVRDSIAFVVYSRRRVLPAEPKNHHFTAAVDTGAPGRPLTIGVPAFIRLREDGRVVGVATGVPHTAKLMEMYGLMSASALNRRIASLKQKGVRPVSTNE